MQRGKEIPLYDARIFLVEFAGPAQNAFSPEYASETLTGVRSLSRMSDEVIAAEHSFMQRRLEPEG